MILIIGGGSSGLMAAITAGNAIGGKNVKILEKNERIGRKLLATGNGRCNLSNINAKPDDYQSDPQFCEYVLKHYGPKHIISIFNRLGLVAKVERDGRVYPKCSQASAVVDVLRNEISRLDIEIIQADVKKLSHKSTVFSVSLSSNKNITCKSVIVATGGRAAPVFGSDGSGYRLLTQMGHKLKAVYPVLVQLRTSFEDIKSLNGIRVYAGISLKVNGNIIAHQEGELQFTNYGISGIPALNVSAKAGQGSEIEIDFSPDTDKTVLLSMLQERVNNLCTLTAENFFVGFFHKSIGRLLLKYEGIPRTLPISDFTQNELNKLTKAIKSFYMPLSGVLSFKEAQATGGGICTDGFNPHTMESLLQKGLFAAGEVLDVYGPCGGYNLQWAWSSGYAAGLSASKEWERTFLT